MRTDPFLRHLLPTGAALCVLCGCTAGFFSGIPFPENTRPVAMIETRGGVELAATTEAGILFLGRTAQEGPCRVHYFLADNQNLFVEDGTIEETGSVYFRARIDLDHQLAPLLARPVTPDDELVALVLAGPQVHQVPVQLVPRGGPVDGDLLLYPGARLPAGAGLFIVDPDGGTFRFVGLIAGEATVETPAGTERYVAFTGVDRLREMLIQPEAHPSMTEVIHRPDGISIFRPINKPIAGPKADVPVEIGEPPLLPGAGLVAPKQPK